MTALVTGGAGFIGSNIVRLLLNEGHHVIVLDNFSTGHRRNLDNFKGVVVIEGDVRDAQTMLHAVEGVEIVFHLAASVGNVRSLERPIEDSEINVIGTLRLLEASRRAGVRKVVFSSSSAIFGELRHLPIREDHPVEPDSPYGVSKLAAEKLCLSYARLYELEAICLRYFNVYGVNQRYDAYGNVIPIFAHCLLRGLPLTVFGDGEQTRDFVNVQDVARANLLAARATGVSGPFNIGSGVSVKINNLVHMMREASGRKTIVTHGPPRKGDVRHSRADISAAQKALGYAPQVALRDGLIEYLTWFDTEMV